MAASKKANLGKTNLEKTNRNKTSKTNTGTNSGRTNTHKGNTDKSSLTNKNKTSTNKTSINKTSINKTSTNKVQSKKNGTGEAKKAEKKGMPVRKNRKSSAVSEKKTETKTESQLYTEIFLWVLVAVSILLMLSNFGAGGIIGSCISNLFFGLFGIVTYVFPVASESHGTFHFPLRHMFPPDYNLPISLFLHILFADSLSDSSFPAAHCRI